MRSQSLQAGFPTGIETEALDLVVPFTTPELTRTALEAAGQLGGDLHARIRLIKIQVVPFPLQQSPVNLAFLRQQLESFRSTLPLTARVLLAREYSEDFMRSLKPGSIVVLASKRRLWRTRTESLAAKLRRAGHRVILVHTHKQNA